MAAISGMVVRHVTDLLERESELADLRSTVTEAQVGAGRLVVVAGPPGIGKTALLGAVRSLAAAEGMAVARARGTELERGFAFGVVRQLFEPLLRARQTREMGRLFSGSARPARAVLGPDAEEPISAGTHVPDVMHGLYWLTLNLTERSPLLALIDDAQWADQPSLRFLSYLAGRLEGVAALVVVALRRGEDPAVDDMVAAIERELTTRVVQLGPLSGPATAELLRGEYGEEVAPDFAHACHRATGGNPFFVRELVRALHADGIAPVSVEAGRVANQGPDAVARSVLTRIAGVSAGAERVVRALAVLGGEAELRDLGQLSSMDGARLDATLSLLAGAEVVVGHDPVTFTHPIVRASIYADMSAAERALAHLRAAHLLGSAGATAERVAAHLLATRPAGDAWTASVLIDASAQALSRGAPDGAVTYLVRALAERSASSDRGQLNGLLGRAEYLAGQRSASAHLIEAMERAARPTEHAELALEAAKALVMIDSDASEAAIRILDRAINQLGRPDAQLSMRLEAQLLAAAGLKLATRPLHRQRIDGVYGRQLGDSPAERLLLANLAAWTLIEAVPERFSDLGRHTQADGPPAEVARRVADRAIAGGALLREEGSDSELFYLPVITLLFGDDLDLAQYWLDQAIEHARTHGSVVGYAQASAFLAEVAYRRGELGPAEAHACAAAAISPGDALAVLVNIMIETERLDEAQRLVETFPIAPEADHIMLQPIRAAAARLSIAQGRPQQGADQLLACGTWLESWSARNPSMNSWRSELALAVTDAEHDRARQLAEEEVALARCLGQPRALGIALRALGLIEQDTDGIDSLREAIDVLGPAAARLEHARALIDYGAALRRRGHRADARKPLREGLDLAHRCGATVLAKRAREELLATGARPRRPALTGRDSLTPTEARVARMAALGLSTREIAQSLFITPKTVETHLAHTYQKLDIHSRAALGQALH